MSRPAGEFRDIDRGDKRLNERAALLAGQLAAKPSGSIPGARGGSAASQAADRFLARPEAGWEAILSPFGAMPKRACVSTRVGRCRWHVSRGELHCRPRSGGTGLGEARRPAPAEQSRGRHVRPSRRTDRVVPGTLTLGVRTVLSCAQEWLPGGGPAIGHGAAPGADADMR